MIHIIDPQGDIVLVLQNPNAEFAVWKSDEEFHAAWEELQREERRKNWSWPSAEDIFSEPDIDKECEAAQTPVDGQENVLQEQTLLTSPSGASEEPDRQSDDELPQPSNEASNLDDEIATTDSDDGKSVRYRVSSRHLILASSYFRSALSKEWKESCELQEKGEAILKAEDWDAEALLVLLNIIHGRNRAVPRSVTLEMLAKIAVLVDYYQCLEAVEPHATIWLGVVKASIPSSYGRDMILWLQICLVFLKVEDLEVPALAIIEGCKGPLQTMSLPIPGDFVATIESERENYISQILTSLEELRSHLTIDAVSCSFECTSMLLGTLTREMYARKLLNSDHRAPYLGLNLIGLTAEVQQFRKPHWYTISNRNSYGNHGCELESYTAPILNEVQENLKKLRFEDWI